MIVGSTTFGKGTVQKVISLDEYLKFSDRLAARNNNEEIGSLKLTIQKFYRVNGGSTQLKGVTPDVVLPDPYDHLDMGERKDKSALEWDEIPAAGYKVVNNPVDVKRLSQLSAERVKNNSTFQLIQDNATRIKKQEEDKTYSLNEAKFKAEQDEANQTADKIKELEEKSAKLTIVNPKEDMDKINRDSVTIAKNADWIKNLSRDIYLSETVNIINDMNKFQSNVNMGMRNK